MSGSKLIEKQSVVWILESFKPALGLLIEMRLRSIPIAQFMFAPPQEFPWAKDYVKSDLSLKTALSSHQAALVDFGSENLNVFTLLKFAGLEQDTGRLVASNLYAVRVLSCLMRHPWVFPVSGADQVLILVKDKDLGCMYAPGLPSMTAFDAFAGAVVKGKVESLNPLEITSGLDMLERIVQPFSPKFIYFGQDKWALRFEMTEENMSLLEEAGFAELMERYLEANIIFENTPYWTLEGLHKKIIPVFASRAVAMEHADLGGVVKCITSDWIVEQDKIRDIQLLPEFGKSFSLCQRVLEGALLSSRAFVDYLNTAPEVEKAREIAQKIELVQFALEKGHFKKDELIQTSESLKSVAQSFAYDSENADFVFAASTIAHDVAYHRIKT